LRVKSVRRRGRRRVRERRVRGGEFAHNGHPKLNKFHPSPYTA
jgi:hypothetical protein